MSEARLPIHPYAELFPAITSPEFDALCGAIAVEGLLEEIVLHEGKILDGRHRYLACLARQVPPRFREYAGECGSPLAFVVAKNLRRRHLTESQRALVAAKLKPLFEEEARQRQRAGLKQGREFPVIENSLIHKPAGDVPSPGGGLGKTKENSPGTGQHRRVHVSDGENTRKMAPQTRKRPS
jgi:hypothetical protein